MLFLLCLCFTIMMMGMLIQCHLCPFLLALCATRTDGRQVYWQNARATDTLGFARADGGKKQEIFNKIDWYLSSDYRREDFHFNVAQS